MSSYLKDSVIERTVILTNAGSPALGVTSGSLTVQTKKAGQTAFLPKTLSPGDWVELGDGFYTLRLASSDTDVVGTFVYRVTGPDFDNLVFDQLNIIQEQSADESQAYFQDVATERTVYLELSGTAATAILPTQVICKIKKAGQVSFDTKVLSSMTWINLGSGYYTIKFSADEMSRVGSFVYTLTGTGFDNFAFDEFTVLPIQDYSVRDKCVVFGQFVGIDGNNPGDLIKITATPVEFPAKYRNRILAARSVYTYLDHEGKFQLPLLRGTTCLIEVPRAGIRHQVNIPDTPSADIQQLLPPFAVDYTI
jgi:hypothetical protein